MQLFHASERFPLRLSVIVAIIAGSTAVGALLLLLLYAGSGRQARSSSVDAVLSPPPTVVIPKPALPSESDAKPNDSTAVAATSESHRPAVDSFASTRTNSVEPISAAANSSTVHSTAIQQYQGSPLDERLLFSPSQYPAGNWDPRGLRVDDAWFNSADGTRLHGWYLPSDKPQAVILYLHGNGGNITDAAVVYRFLEKYLKVTTLAFDYRGYGRSDGRPTIDGVVADARAARAWLAKKAGVPESSIVLMGRSLGGAVAVQLTADVKPRALILENTFASLRAMARYHLPNLADLVPADRLDSGALLSHYDGPLLQCHADADRTVPFESGEELFRAAKGRKEFFRAVGLGHNAQLPDEYYGKLMEFVAALK